MFQFIWWRTIPRAKQTTLIPKSFVQTFQKLDNLINAVSVFATSASADIRKIDQVSSVINVFLETNRFSVGSQYTPSQSVELSPATITPNI
ncbi:MAG: hypothetical protein ACKVIK_11265 [Rhodospirillales bacterium]